MLCTGIWKRQEHGHKEDEHGHEEDEHGHEANSAQQVGVSEETSTSLSLSFSLSLSLVHTVTLTRCITTRHGIPKLIVGTTFVLACSL